MQWMKQINSDYFIYLDELTYCMKIEMEARILHIIHKNYDCNGETVKIITVGLML